MKTPVTDATFAIQGTTQTGREQTWRPSRTFNLGLPQTNSNNQIQLVKAIPPNGGSIGGGIGPGIPQPVQNVRIVRSSISATQYKLTVSYQHDPSDQNHQGVQVSIAQGGGNAGAVGGGSTSPISVVVNKSTASSVVSVAATGRWGNSTSVHKAVSIA